MTEQSGEAPQKIVVGVDGSPSSKNALQWAVLQAQLSKLDLVSREEFDVQAAILERTQAKLTAMEARLKEIEGRLTPQ